MRRAHRPSNARAALAALGVFAIALAGCGGAKDETSTSTATTTPAAGIYGEGAFADMTLGDPNAPVTIIEYASVTCPVCAAFHQQIFPDLKTKYIDTGKAKFVFREFPAHNATLTFAGSMLARCAAEKGGEVAYFAIVNKLFDTQAVWSEGDNPRQELQKVALEAGIDQDGFEACIRREDLLNLLNKVASNARDDYSVGGTPTFIVGDAVMTSGWTLEAFDKAIEKAAASAAK